MPVPHLLGVSLAVIAAASFAVQYLCVRIGTVRGSVRTVVFVSLLTNVVLIVPLALLWYGVPTVTPAAVLWFAAAGFAGSLLARLCLFKSVETIGASRTSPIAATNVFFATILAVLLFGEPVTLLHGVGIVLLVGGVAVISWETAVNETENGSLSEVGVYLSIPLIAAVFLGIEPIFVSLGLDTGTPILTGVAIKAVAATSGFVGFLVVSGAISRELYRWTPDMKWHLAAGVTSTIGIVCLFAALAVAPVVIVAPLIQTSPLIVVVLSAVFLPRQLERVTWRLFAAAAVVVLGVGIVSVH